MSDSAQPQREILPIPDVMPPGLTTYDAKDPDTAFPPITPLRPPDGAPNVLVVLVDDVGFGASSAFGGPCYTPTFERLAREGLRYPATFAVRVHAESELQPITVQEARHTAATWLDAAGVPPKIASVRMGHATPERQPGAAQITLARYTHALPEDIEKHGRR